MRYDCWGHYPDLCVCLHPCFFFFPSVIYDGGWAGRISIDSLVRSRIMQELLELRMAGTPNNTDGNGSRKGDLLEKLERVFYFGK